MGGRKHFDCSLENVVVIVCGFQNWISRDVLTAASYHLVAARHTQSKVTSALEAAAKTSQLMWSSKPLPRPWPQYFLKVLGHSRAVVYKSCNPVADRVQSLVKTHQLSVLHAQGSRVFRLALKTATSPGPKSNVNVSYSPWFRPPNCLFPWLRWGLVFQCSKHRCQ